MTILSAIVLLGILIFVHELGHFIVAKTVGVKVLKFSLGFGPKVIGKTYGETEYLISAFPLGGYVKMLGEDPEDEFQEHEIQRTYKQQPVWKRFAIVFAGPLFNLCFAALVFFLLFMSGVPASYPDVGKVAAGSPAEKVGLMTGDRVIEINGSPVQSWDEIFERVDETHGSPLVFKVRRDAGIRELKITPQKKSEENLFGEQKDVWDIGISPLVYPVIGEVTKGSRADKAGLKKGDRITAIDGVSLNTWQDMTAIIHDSPDKPLRFSIARDGSTLEMTITPEKKTIKKTGGAEKAMGLIGIRPLENSFIRKFGMVDSVRLGIKKTWDISELTLLSIVKLVQRVIPSDTIGGPIMIFEMAGQQASNGALSFFTFMGIISINLGIMNLFPVPILDGGHLLFLGIEAVIRRPLSEKFIMNAQRVGLVLLITLMVFATYNDILRLITGKTLP